MSCHVNMTCHDMHATSLLNTQASAMVICSVLLTCDFIATRLKWIRRREIIEFCDGGTSFDHSKQDSVHQLNAAYGAAGTDYQVKLYEGEGDPYPSEWVPLPLPSYKVPKYKDAIVAECQWFPFVPWTKKEIPLPTEDDFSPATARALLDQTEDEAPHTPRQTLKRWRENRQRREFFGGQTLVERTNDALPLMLDNLHGEFQVRYSINSARGVSGTVCHSCSTVGTGSFRYDARLVLRGEFQVRRLPLMLD